MEEKAKIVEAILLNGRLLVTFVDGKVALLEPGPIYSVAVSAESFHLPQPQKLV